MRRIKKGKVVVVEVELKKRVAFGTSTYFNPTTQKIDIISPDGTKVVDNQDLTTGVTGKFSYIWTSASSDESGKYEVRVRITDGVYSEEEIFSELFRLMDI